MMEPGHCVGPRLGGFQTGGVAFVAWPGLLAALLPAVTEWTTNLRVSATTMSMLASFERRRGHTSPA